MAPKQARFDDTNLQHVLETVGNSDIFMPIWTSKYAVETAPVMQLAAALLLDKPMYILLEKGQALPQSVTRLARGTAVFSKDDDDSLNAAVRKLLTQAAEDGHVTLPDDCEP